MPLCLWRFGEYTTAVIRCVWWSSYTLYDVRRTGRTTVAVQPAIHLFDRSLWML